MSSELAVFKLFCQDRQLYDTYHTYTLSLKNLERELKLVQRLISDFYERYADALSIERDDLLTFFDIMYPNHKDRVMYREIVTSIFATVANPDIAKDLLEQVMEKHFASAVVSKLIPVVEGNKYGVLHTLDTDIQEYVSRMRNPPVSKVELLPFEKSLEETAGVIYPEGGINWLFPSLTKIVGPVCKQTLGVIFAYVDAGKTSFGIRNFVHFAHQLRDTEETVIYAGNEEAAPRISFRMTQAIVGKTRSEILEDTSDAALKRSAAGWGRIKLFDSITTMEQVEKLLVKFHPSILFIDQGTKVSLPTKGGGADSSDTYKLQEVFNTYRELAKQHDVAITVLAQATGEAENKKWLNLSDMYGSRVVMQGELDYAIGIGKTLDDPSRENIRYVHVCKNKLLDGSLIKFMTHFVKEKCAWHEI